jgi:hypothetical protein
MNEIGVISCEEQKGRDVRRTTKLETRLLTPANPAPLASRFAVPKSTSSILTTRFGSAALRCRSRMMERYESDAAELVSEGVSRHSWWTVPSMEVIPVRRGSASSSKTARGEEMRGEKGRTSSLPVTLITRVLNVLLLLAKHKQVLRRRVLQRQLVLRRQSCRPADRCLALNVRLERGRRGDRTRSSGSSVLVEKDRNLGVALSVLSKSGVLTE